MVQFIVEKSMITRTTGSNCQRQNSYRARWTGAPFNRCALFPFNFNQLLDIKAVQSE